MIILVKISKETSMAFSKFNIFFCSIIYSGSSSIIILRTVLSYVENNVENNNLRKILSFSPKAF